MVSEDDGPVAGGGITRLSSGRRVENWRSQIVRAVYFDDEVSLESHEDGGPARLIISAV
jgi:hypothetical protein